MSAPLVKGWCPGALRPMLSGDGWLVRVRPPLGRLTAAQVAGIAGLSQAHGSGLIDLSSRANVQMRGIAEDRIGAVQDRLAALDLLDADAAAEARRNVMVQPFWRDGDATMRIARALDAALVAAEDLALPGKFGFAVDCGEAPVLRHAAADVRVETSGERFILHADGASDGVILVEGDVVPVALDLARWFAATGLKRMRQLASAGVTLPRRFRGDALPVAGEVHDARLRGAAFGRMRAEVFGQLGAVRVTPWRMVLCEDGTPDLPGLLMPGDPLLAVSACPGAPDCAQGLGETRTLAKRLARAGLHVSGCAKGCAHPRPAPLTVVAQEGGRYAIIRNGCAGDAPVRSGLDPAAITPALLNEG